MHEFVLMYPFYGSLVSLAIPFTSRPFPKLDAESANRAIVKFGYWCIMVVFN